MNNDVKLVRLIRINTPLRRRGLVLVFYASMALGCDFSVLALRHLGTSRLLYSAGMVTSFFILGACWVALMQLLREYGFVGDHRLHTSRDERQDQVRQAAYVRSYWVLSALLCLSAGAYLGGAWTFPRLASEFSKPLVAIAIVLMVTLPSAVMAWTEPELEEVA